MPIKFNFKQRIKCNVKTLEASSKQTKIPKNGFMANLRIMNTRKYNSSFPERGGFLYSAISLLSFGTDLKKKNERSTISYLPPETK